MRIWADITASAMWENGKAESRTKTQKRKWKDSEEKYSTLEFYLGSILFLLEKQDIFRKKKVKGSRL